MKQSRGLYQKILDFFHLAPPSPCVHSDDKSKSSSTLSFHDSVSDEKRSSSSSGSHVENSTDSNDRTPGRTGPLSREELEAKIVKLWKDVWLGLYQVQGPSGPRHYDRIRTLCDGAGLTTVRLWQIDRHFWRHNGSENKGVAGLTLYEHLSVSTLESVVELLQSYESEIENLENLYRVLRQEQLGIHSATPSSHTYSRYTGVAAPLAKRLSRYDARMDVLKMDIYDEAMALHAADCQLRKGWLVYDKAFGYCW